MILHLGKLWCEMARLRSVALTCLCTAKEQDIKQPRALALCLLIGRLLTRARGQSLLYFNHPAVNSPRLFTWWFLASKISK